MHFYHPISYLVFFYLHTYQSPDDFYTLNISVVMFLSVVCWVLHYYVLLYSSDSYSFLIPLYQKKIIYCIIK